MRKAIIHLSDIHYHKGWIEGHGVVLDAFFQDLNKQINQINNLDVYLAFSGDIVQAGAHTKQYEDFLIEFDQRLNVLGIPKNKRLCVPGNHDISTLDLSSNMLEHEGVVSQALNEHQFNDYVAKSPNVFSEKFRNYKSFELQFSDLGSLRGSSLGGAGWDIDEFFGVYCLNSALCSSGGLKGLDGKNIHDWGRLSVDTRNLYAWNLNCKAHWKILIMHHPISWLTEWAKKEIMKILQKDFALCLSGHAHDQSTFHSISNGNSLVLCSAPPLFTSKHDELGYSIILLSDELGTTDIIYRQWTKHNSFVAGVNFSNTDDGKVVVSLQADDTKTKIEACDSDFIDRYLTKKLDDALVSYSTQPKVWVKPVLSNYHETSRSAKSKPKKDITQLISKPNSMLIKSLPQFGLTCLAHYLIREAWRQESCLWLYLDSKVLKSHNASIRNALEAELAILRCDESQIKCIVIDSWTDNEKHSIKLLETICSYFKELPVVVMQTIENVSLLTEEKLSVRQFEIIYLWSLTRSQIREIVASYNEVRHIGDEDIVTARIASDLAVLNLHRTPLNCLTLLKVSEIDFDESPVNRSEMIKRILFLIFNVDNIPTYKSRPDLKDCEYVLGYFCETMLRHNNFIFTRDYFIKILQECCKERFIDLEVQIVFDVLYINNILIRHGNLFSFRFAFWVYYFIAQRMHHDKNLASFIFEELRYASFPEIIEFYTGIDRCKEDALQVLINDIRKIYDNLSTKHGFPINFDPYKIALWKPSEVMLGNMQDIIKNGVKASNLPAVVKDQYADRMYDQSNPYNQEVRDVLKDHTLLTMLSITKAASRALRNSDYVDPETKRILICEIMKCWEYITKILVVFAPVLAIEGDTIIDGVNVKLGGNFGNTPHIRLLNILFELPSSTVFNFGDDLFSQKMGPLLIDYLDSDDSDLRKHELILLLINQRPRGWKAQVHKYISSMHKNSFYLLDVYKSLRSQYQYSFTSYRSLQDIEYLIKMVAAKHKTGSKSPGIKLINKIDDAVLPTREVEECINNEA